MDPLDYMVKDCWLHLFRFLPAKDKQTLCHICETFHAMLQPEKVKWGLELVLPYILPKIIQFDRNRSYDSQPRPYLQALVFRLVCKSWKSTFDKYCADSNWMYSSLLTMSHYTFSTSHRPHRDTGVSELEKFLKFFKDHSGNPFIGRSVNLSCVSIEHKYNLNDNEDSSNPGRDEAGEATTNENERLERERKAESLKTLQSSIQLVTKYGKEINHLELTNVVHYATEFCGQLDACKFLQLVLCNTPNLQSLSLDFNRYSEHDFTNTSPEKVTEYFALNPFPRMTQLRKLTFSNEGINKNALNLLLEAYGENLQRLMLSKVEKVSDFDWGRMRSLTRLDLHKSDFESTVKILQALPSTLETLVFEESYQTGTSKVFWMDKFLLGIQHLPLKNIKLSMRSKILKESVPFPRDFPKHQTITNFTIYHLNVISFGFLQFLPQLKSLNVGGMKIRLPLFRQLK